MGNRLNRSSHVELEMGKRMASRSNQVDIAVQDNGKDMNLVMT